MRHLTELYEVESGEKALYRVGASDYHTLRYVKWLEAKVEPFTSYNKQSTPCQHLRTRSGGFVKPDICDDCGEEL